jgi:hypothetical protein
MGLLDIDENVVRVELTEEYMNSLPDWMYDIFHSKWGSKPTYYKNIYWPGHNRLAGTIYYEVFSKDWYFSADRWRVGSDMRSNDCKSIGIKSNVHTSDVLELWESMLKADLNTLLSKNGIDAYLL